MFGRTILFAVAPLLLLGLESCTDSRPNVLLITLDTVRSDRIGCYGYSRARTPNLDALAGRGVRFERAYAHTPYTLPSHATMMTGLYPNGHGVHVNFQGAIDPEAPVLADILAQQGYRSAAFVASSVLDRRFGLARGFGLYDDLSDRPLDASEQVERPGNEVTQSAVTWFEKPSPGPFFAWVHYYDAHDPHEPPEGFRNFEDPYDGEISFVDAQVGQLIATLESLGKLANTYIIVVADHGEAFGEHGEGGHGLFVYDSTMHVPMIMAGPAHIRAGTTVHDPVGLVDVHPTVLALLGMPATKGVEGSSLLPASSAGQALHETLQIESEYPLRAFGWAPLYGVIAGTWKYIRAPEEELYDLVADPLEEHNQVQARADVHTSLAAALTDLRKRGARRPARDVHLGLDARNALSKLGYVEGPDIDETSSVGDLVDPKSMAFVAAGAVKARALLRNGSFDEVVVVLKPLLAASPESGHLWLLQGSAELGLNRPQDAIRSFEKSLKSFPKSTERLRKLGDALLAAGRTNEALVRYREALALDPEDGQNESRLGTFYARAGKFDEAVAHFQRFADLEPNSPNAHTNLANALFAKSRFEEGIDQLKRALKLDSRCVPAHQAMYAVRHQRHEQAAAVEALRAGVAALPRDPYFRSRLAWELATTRTSSNDAAIEAIQLARACTRESPQDPVLLDVLAAALARHGEFPEAIEVEQTALGKANAQANAALADGIQKRLALYRSGQPYLE